MVFLAISVVSLIEADDDTNNSIGIGQEPPTPWKTITKNNYASLHLTDAVRSTAEQEKL